MPSVERSDNGRPTVSCRRHPARVPKLPAVTAYRVLGTAGAAILACAGWAAGALPVHQPDTPLWLIHWRDHSRPALLGGYLGLTLLTVAWWWAGRELQRHGGVDRRSLLTTLALWSSPLLLGPPLFSRDVYSYLAQGSMVLTDIDVYRFGVSRLGGRLAAEVPAMWQHTPAPYGPLFLGLAAVVAGLVGTKVTVGILGMRLLALAGVGLLVVFLPRLARHCGVPPMAALWLGVLNPLVPLHLIAGAHNEAVMLGLLVPGLCLAFERRFVLATVLVTLAALVKAPAVAGLLVVVSLWAPYRLGGLAALRAGGVMAALRAGGVMAALRAGVPALLGTAAIAAVTTAAVSAVTGIGYGWLAALSTPISKHSWSLSSALGRGSTALLEALGVEAGEAPMRFWLWAGLLAALGTAAFAWWHRHRLGPAYALGLALAAVALLGPATRPWYGLWGLVPLAASAPPGRVRGLVAAGATALAFVTMPDGFGPDGDKFLLAVAGVLLGVVAVLLVLATRAHPRALPGGIAAPLPERIAAPLPGTPR
ncbi:polyprenol phosphomannose-dependent alpha 1,6 mannosyltransferase MptB [Micromonospora sp. NPDC049559]|uniref:polyprenol phosphomannose-dependent alpha 1,6 mannosyltransferase MptB n=1 Tax=Micromonospora sp. NPDC049559 TaxID=3155923 RepID=UPI0034252422